MRFSLLGNSDLGKGYDGVIVKGSDFRDGWCNGNFRSEKWVISEHLPGLVTNRRKESCRRCGSRPSQRDL